MTDILRNTNAICCHLRRYLCVQNTINPTRYRINSFENTHYTVAEKRFSAAFLRCFAYSMPGSDRETIL